MHWMHHNIVENAQGQKIYVKEETNEILEVRLNNATIMSKEYEPEPILLMR